MGLCRRPQLVAATQRYPGHGSPLWASSAGDFAAGGYQAYPIQGLHHWPHQAPALPTSRRCGDHPHLLPFMVRECRNVIIQVARRSSLNQRSPSEEVGGGGHGLNKE